MTKCPSALIFRKRLLAYSETFVANQGYALQRYRPVFVGFEEDKRGLHHLQRKDVSLLSDVRARVELARFPWPSTLMPVFMPISWRIGPLTIRIGPTVRRMR